MHLERKKITSMLIAFARGGGGGGGGTSMLAALSEGENQNVHCAFRGRKPECSLRFQREKTRMFIALSEGENQNVHCALVGTENQHAH